MRLQLADPAEHPHLGALPFAVDLADWDLPHMHGVLGLHRHVVRLVELGQDGNRTSYVVKELPDHLALREYRLLRGLVEDRLPTVIVVAVVTERTGNRDGLLITRHLDYSLPYRTLLSGRGMTIPYLGEKLLDSLVGLLVRLHLAGFFWGDCSLSNALFRRDAGALQAYIIDVETSERYESLSDGQRQMDLDIATENVAGGLLDLQLGGRLVEDIDPWEVASNLESRYRDLWNEITATEESDSGELWRIEQRVRRLHDLGFDVGEMEITADEEGRQIRFVPRVVDSDYHQDRSVRAHRAVGRAEPGAAAARRHPRASAPSCRSAAAAVRRRTSPPCGGSTSASSRSSAPSRRRCWASCSRPSSTTSCSSTAGS